MTSLLRSFQRLTMIAGSGTLAAAMPLRAKARSAARRTRSSGRARRSGSARGAAARWLLLAPTTSRFETACSAPTKRHGAQPCGSARRSALASRTQASTSHPMSGPAPSRRLEPKSPPAPIIPAALAAGACSEITARFAKRVLRTRLERMGFPASRAHLAASRMMNRPNACSASQVVLVASGYAPFVRPARQVQATGQAAFHASQAHPATPSRPLSAQSASRAAPA
jgi:hypothetical protein